MKRLLTSAVLIPPVLYVVLAAPQWLFFCVVALVSFVCFHEYGGIAAHYGIEKLGPVGYAAGLALLLVDSGQAALVTVLALAALALAMRVDDLRQCLPQAGLLLIGIVYAFGPWKFAIELRDINPYWLLFALLLNWVGDACAYYAGRAFGTHRLAPRVSPGKTWEGTIISLSAAVLFGVAFNHWFRLELTIPEAVILSLIANACGQIGDLSESALKRGAGVKDSGNLLPGHGGLLDRVDSTLFSMPAIYLFLQL
ncbi:MAG: phosphatidate cytidylyltransferase [Bryobacteraceae bacterium]